ncbi:MAG: SurA N-terminal domain-containing protein [Clostridiales bacterium]|nr:SurA N-terminal domain-containing protein [Clostridiales bacterium]
MRKSTKKTIAIAAVVLVAVAALVLGIYAISQDDLGLNWFQRQPAVVRVNGDEVSAHEFALAYKNAYEMSIFYAQYGMSYYTDTNVAGWENNLKNMIVDEFIRARIYVQQAVKYELSLTDEEKAAMKQAGKDAVQGLRDECLLYAVQSGYAGAEAAEELKAVQNNTEDEIEDSSAAYVAHLNGLGMINTSARNQVEKMMTDTMLRQGTTLSAYRKSAEQAYYDKQLTDKLLAYYEAEIYKQNDADLPALYADYAQFFEDEYTASDMADYINQMKYGGVSHPALYIPEDALFLRYIEVGEDEAKADDIMARLEAGEDFESIVASEENISEFGRTYALPYAVTAMDNFLPDEVFEALTKLETGAYGLAQRDTVTPATEEEEETVTSYYYIILRVEGSTGIMAYETVKDMMRDTLISYDRSKAFAALYAEWEKATKTDTDDARINKLVSHLMALVAAAAH